MKLQEKFLAVADRAHDLALNALSLGIEQARSGAQAARRRTTQIKSSVASLKGVGLELRDVVTRHAGLFVRQNRTLATSAGKDLLALARSTVNELKSERPVARRQPKRRAPARRARRVV